jgi:hypothetical protein
MTCTNCGSNVANLDGAAIPSGIKARCRECSMAAAECRPMLIAEPTPEQKKKQQYAKASAAREARERIGE